MENLLLETMYDLPDMEGLEEVVIEEKTVTDGKSPTFVYADKKKKAPKSKAKEG